MTSGKTVKLLLYEALQLAALLVPVFVVMERFARLVRGLRGQDETAYWLVVAAALAYVTSVTLLVWAPLKYVILKRRNLVTDITQWRPTALAYVILCTLPCFAIFVASSKVTNAQLVFLCSNNTVMLSGHWKLEVQMDFGFRLDHFAELPVSLVLFSLICVDITERLRPFRLLGPSDSLDPDLDLSPVLTHLEPVSTISNQLRPDPECPTGPDPPEDQPKSSVPGRWRPPANSPVHSTVSSAYLYSSPSRRRWSHHSGGLGLLWRRDGRSQVFVEAFLFWLDTVEMLRVAGEPALFYSNWIFPVFILSFLSCLRVVIAPHCPLVSSAGVALQDFPFFVVRVALILVFGHVTPVLFPLKNIMVCLTYIYFTLVSRLCMFGRQSMF